MILIKPMTAEKHLQDEIMFDRMGLHPIPELKPNEKVTETVMIRKQKTKVVFWRRGKQVLNITKENGEVLYQAPFFSVDDSSHRG